MEKTCKQCHTSFEITEGDLSFLEKISPIFNGKKSPLPSPVFCPACRQQRRLAWRNERKLHQRKCDATGREIISMYSPEKPFKVFHQDVWWGDTWDALSYGKDFDFSKNFSEQFHDLLFSVPHIALINQEPENSQYCNFSWRNKNSYLTFTSGLCEDSYYVNRAWKVKDVCDSSNIMNSEMCYEMVDCYDCYDCRYLQNSSLSSSCEWGYDLQGCKNCFGCVGLRSKQFYFLNQPLTQEAYLEKMKSFSIDQDFLDAFAKLKNESVRKYIDGFQNENVTGNVISYSKNAFDCFNVKELQDCKYVQDASGLKDSYDVDCDDRSECVYNSIGGEKCYMHMFNISSWFDSFAFYSYLCFHSSNLFGCVGLKKQNYCILNKQYSKEDYEAMVSRIIEHMKSNGEWGEFFDPLWSPFAYNETVAQEYFPLEEAQVLAQGLHWKKEEDASQYQGVVYQVPSNISEVQNDILQGILRCEVTDRPFKITKQELELYRKMNIPIPRRCPDQRHKDRMSLRNPRKVWDRKCAKCGLEMKTSYDPERPESVYCEKCYLESVY